MREEVTWVKKKKYRDVNKQASVFIIYIFKILNSLLKCIKLLMELFAC